MVNQQFPSSFTPAYCWIPLSSACLPRALISCAWSLTNFSPLDLWMCIVLSYGHFQPHWCQLSLKWQCCGIRNSGPWSSVWVPWPLSCQYFLPNLDTICLVGPCSDCSSSLFLSVNMEDRETHLGFSRVLGCQFWHFSVLFYFITKHT